VKEYQKDIVVFCILVGALIAWNVLVDDANEPANNETRAAAEPMHLTEKQILAAAARRPSDFEGLDLNTVSCRDMLIRSENAKLFLVKCYAKDRQGAEIDITAIAQKSVDAMHKSLNPILHQTTRTQP
jgi:hypothetical protein